MLSAFRVRAVALVTVIASFGLFLSAGSPSARAAAAPWTSTATVGPSPAPRGAKVTFTVKVASTTAKSALVDLEVYGSGSTRAFTQVWDNQAFAAGVSRTFTATWTVPAGEALVAHPVKVGVFSPGWGTLYLWNDTAASFAVTTPVATTTTTTTTTLPPTTTTTVPPTTTTTVPAVPWTATATASPTQISPGTTVTFTARVTSSTTRSALVDLEVYAGTQARNFQQVWDNQAFAAGVSRTFTATWTVPAGEPLDTHSVQVGVFNPGWGTLYLWNGKAASFVVTTPATTTTTTTTPTTTIPPTTTTTVAPTTGRCQQTTTRICYNGRLWYVNGLNMPWRQWSYAPGHGDFGGGTTDGVIANRADIASRFAQVHNTGSTVVRWWMFEGGAWQINRDSSGTPTSLNPAIYADIDAALQLANQYNLYYDFTLFSGVAAGDFPTTWRTNPSQRQALANVLGPLFARYKDNPRIMTWELFNEPEWQIWNNVDGANAADCVALANVLVSSIRTNAPKTMTTIGEAKLDGNPMWKNVDLDFDSPHYYDPMTGADVNALANTAAGVQARYGMSRPMVIGEFPFVGSAAQNVTRLNDLYGRGYAGAW
ncbi:MAG: hypothetical protein QOD72_3065, partial [Acidimicrobiaceae bacterium]|nr:hypothetical protein [Acidimicrobiaceae bacterium]